MNNVRLYVVSPDFSYFDLKTIVSQTKKKIVVYAHKSALVMISPEYIENRKTFLVGRDIKYLDGVEYVLVEEGQPVKINDINIWIPTLTFLIHSEEII